jgi:hypothetical protein
MKILPKKVYIFVHVYLGMKNNVAKASFIFIAQKIYFPYSECENVFFCVKQL